MCKRLFQNFGKNIVLACRWCGKMGNTGDWQIITHLTLIRWRFFMFLLPTDLARVETLIIWLSPAWKGVIKNLSSWNATFVSTENGVSAAVMKNKHFDETYGHYNKFLCMIKHRAICFKQTINYRETKVYGNLRMFCGRKENVRTKNRGIRKENH